LIPRNLQHRLEISQRKRRKRREKEVIHQEDQSAEKKDLRRLCLKEAMAQEMELTNLKSFLM